MTARAGKREKRVHSTARPRSYLSAQVPPIICAAAVLSAPSAHATSGNDMVLAQWQARTGQVGQIDEGGRVRWVGGVTADAYEVAVKNATANPALTGAAGGTHQRVVLQSETVGGDPKAPTVFARLAGTATDDRSQQPQYREQINHLQIGFGGSGWQVAAGDVVAAYSPLVANVGLRGFTAAAAAGRLSIGGSVGVIAESWEALSKRSTLTGQAPRSAFLREVATGQLAFRPAADWTLSANGVRFRDRPQSAPLAPEAPAFSGRAATARIGYAGKTFELGWEAGASETTDRDGQRRDGYASALSGALRSGTGTWQLRFGYNALQPEYKSLATPAAPGVKEGFVGLSLSPAPALQYALDLRHGDSRTPATTVMPAAAVTQSNATQRVAYRFAALPALSVFATSQSNRREEADGVVGRNGMHEVGLQWADGGFNASLGLGGGAVRGPVRPAADVDLRQLQATIGYMGAPGDRGLSGGATLNANLQRHRFLATGDEAETLALALNAQLADARFGTWRFGVQRMQQDSTVPGQARLLTVAATFDGTLSLTRGAQAKLYGRLNRRNQGSAALFVQERILGLQGSYQW